MKFNGEGNSWYANFVVRPNSLVSPIDSLMLTHTAYSVFGWKTLSANHLILSALVVDPRFNVMSYMEKHSMLICFITYVQDSGII